MPSPFHVETLSLGSMNNNVYVLRCARTRESAVIDASHDAERILEALQGTTPRYILLTHGDPDHIDALPRLREMLKVPVAIHQADASRFQSPPEIQIVDGQTFAIGDVRLEARHTPGHTPGSTCFVGEETLFSGDTLFPGGPGATHGTREDFLRVIESIRSRLFILPDATLVKPGHGQGTTIGNERPHLQEWIDRGW